jgi:tetratricopeptide (TPR) repeat protein
MKNQFKEELKHEKDKLLGYIWAHAQLGMRKEAIMDCKNLIALDENDPNSRLELGIVYEEHNQIDNAIQYYCLIIKRFPNYHKAYTNLGHLFQEYKKRLDVAMVCYEKALELDPEDFWALHNIGTILKKEQKIKEALYYFKMAYKIAQAKASADRKITHNLAWALYRSKKLKKALYLYSLLADQYDDDGAIHFEFGCVNYKLGRYREALLQFDKATSCQQDNQNYRRAWGITFDKAWGFSGCFVTSK